MMYVMNYFLTAIEFGIHIKHNLFRETPILSVLLHFKSMHQAQLVFFSVDKNKIRCLIQDDSQIGGAARSIFIKLSFIYYEIVIFLLV